MAWKNWEMRGPDMPTDAQPPSSEPISVARPDGPPERRSIPPWLPIATVVGVALFVVAALALFSGRGNPVFTPAADAGDQPVLDVRLSPATFPESSSHFGWLAYAEGPTYTVMLDGRLIVGRMTWDSPTMLRVPSVVDIGVDRVAEVIAAAEQAGLPDIDTEVDETAADPMFGTSHDVNWMFRYTDDAGDHELAVFALDAALEFFPSERYTTLFDLYRDLGFWAYEDAPSLGDLDVERIEMMVGTSVRADPAAADDVSAPWPLKEAVVELPLYVDGIRCIVVAGEDVDRLRDFLMSLPDGTPLAEGDQWHLVMARALVPGEAGCLLPAA